MLRRWAVAIALLTLWGGCATPEYVSLRRAPRNPLADSLQLLSRRGPQPTPRTVQLLRRHDLVEEQEDAPEAVLRQLQQEIAAEPTPGKVYSVAELAYIQGRKTEAHGDRAAALNLYSASVAHAYDYLFDPRYDFSRNPYDPQFRKACDLYNGALEAALRIVNRDGNLRPGGVVKVTAGDQAYEVTIVARGPWRAEEFGRLEFVSDYEIKGLTNRHHTYGLGVPLIVVRRQGSGEAAAEQYYPQGLSFAATAFLRVTDGPSPAVGGPPTCRRCLLELYDPLATRDIQVGQRLAPLETDLTTPLAYFLNNPTLRETDIATWGLLNPNRTADLSGLFMLEPYDPGKIPVLLVHGVWSSPLTWMEMYNDLRSYPEIRDNYQFWFYLYPTGEPFWYSAAQLRQDLARARTVLDPQRRTPSLSEMVLVGHSMGGLVAMLQVIESGDRFWKLVSDRPFSDLRAPSKERDKLRETLFFEPDPAIRRVIAIGTPYRGSKIANNTTRWLAKRLITLPKKLIQTVQQVVLLNPGVFRDPELLTITTSIDSLAPDSPFLPAMLLSPRAPWVKYDNIVAVVPDEGIVGKISGEGDGVVSQASAHLDTADSELVVPADHLGVQRHPRTILDVRRILLDHLDQMRRETGTDYASTRGRSALPPGWGGRETAPQLERQTLAARRTVRRPTPPARSRLPGDASAATASP